MQRRYLLLALLAAALAAGVGWYALRENRIENLFGGSTNVAIVAKPTKVEAYRLGSLPKHIYWQDATPADYPIIGGPVVLPESIAARVSEALLSPVTFCWDVSKGCTPVYGVQLSFFRQSDRLDVLLCFECDMLWISRDGRGVGGEDFDNSRAVLVRAAKAAFPDDAEIQRLNENRNAE